MEDWLLPNELSSLNKDVYFHFTFHFKDTDNSFEGVPF